MHDSKPIHKCNSSTDYRQFNREYKLILVFGCHNECNVCSWEIIPGKMIHNEIYRLIAHAAAVKQSNTFTGLDQWTQSCYDNYCFIISIFSLH